MKERKRKRWFGISLIGQTSHGAMGNWQCGVHLCCRSSFNLVDLGCCGCWDRKGPHWRRCLMDYALARAVYIYRLPVWPITHLFPLLTIWLAWSAFPFHFELASESSWFDLMMMPASGQVHWCQSNKNIMIAWELKSKKMKTSSCGRRPIEKKNLALEKTTPVRKSERGSGAWWKRYERCCVLVVTERVAKSWISYLFTPICLCV